MSSGCRRSWGDEGTVEESEFFTEEEMGYPVDSKEEGMFIYVLRCQHNKYYVGKTHNVQKRFQQHINNDRNVKVTPSASWCRLYEPLEVVSEKPMISEYDEDNTTIEWMRSKGMNNVRGGTFSSIHLPGYQMRTLQDIICGIEGRCYKCQEKGHVAANCVRHCDERN